MHLLAAVARAFGLGYAVREIIFYSGGRCVNQFFTLLYGFVQVILFAHIIIYIILYIVYQYRVGVYRGVTGIVPVSRHGAVTRLHLGHRLLYIGLLVPIHVKGVAGVLRNIVELAVIGKSHLRIDVHIVIDRLVGLYIDVDAGHLLYLPLCKGCAGDKTGNAGGDFHADGFAAVHGIGNKVHESGKI